MKELRKREESQKKEKLQEYFLNGDWLHDYELDEKKLLPQGLKRGVLSQDGLYDLLCQVAAGKESE